MRSLRSRPALADGEVTWKFCKRAELSSVPDERVRKFYLRTYIALVISGFVLLL